MTEPNLIVIDENTTEAACVGCGERLLIQTDDTVDLLFTPTGMSALCHICANKMRGIKTPLPEEERPKKMGWLEWCLWAAVGFAILALMFFTYGRILNETSG